MVKNIGWILDKIEVAPLAGAWIEIYAYSPRNMMLIVAPLAGAWIEMREVDLYSVNNFSRSPRGSVDWNFIEQW